jgi:hypothetical protein
MKRKYEIKKREDGKMAIFDLRTGEQISQWFDEIYFSERLEVMMGIYLASEDDQWAIFDLQGNQISDWFDEIKIGRKNYYIARKNGKEAIYDFKGNRISEFFDFIALTGFADRNSDFYLAKKDGKYAIFYKDGTRISDWFDDIEIEGLIKRQSNLYIAKKDGKYAIFNKDGEQISQWFDYIHQDGLVKNQSDYYIAGHIRDYNKKKLAVYYKDGRKVSKDFQITGNIFKIEFKEEEGIAEIETYSGKTRTIDFNPVYPFKENLPDYTKLLNI